MKKLIFLFLVFAHTAFSQNYVHTFAGSGSMGMLNGSVDSCSFNGPFGMCMDRLGNLYIADADNHCIRKISGGVVSKIAGIGTAGFRDGVADSAQFDSPSDLCVDDSGNVYVSDFANQRIRKISGGQVTTIAGNGVAAFVNGNGIAARFNYPRGICRDSTGNLYVADSWNHRIRKIDQNKNVTTYAGTATAVGVGTAGGFLNGQDTVAEFHTPSGLAIDVMGNIFVADAYNHRIRKIDTGGMVTTYSGSGATGVGNGGYHDDSLGLAIYNTPTELFIDTLTNDLYIGDTFNNKVRKVSNGMVTTYAGSGSAGFHNDVDSLSTFNFPRGIVFNSITGNVFVCDYNNNVIRAINAIPFTDVNEIFTDECVVFPNPARDVINIRGVSGINSVEIFDMQGNLIERINSGLNRIDVTKLSKGIYFLRIISKHEIIVKEFSVY